MCLDLESENININYTDNIDLIPSDVKENKKETLVIYTPAIPKSNQQFSYFKDNRYKNLKRSELLAKDYSGTFYHNVLVPMEKQQLLQYLLIFYTVQI